MRIGNVRIAHSRSHTDALGQDSVVDIWNTGRHHAEDGQGATDVDYGAEETAVIGRSHEYVKGRVDEDRDAAGPGNRRGRVC